MCSGEWAKAVRGESQPMNALVLGWAREKMVRKRRGGGETQAGNAVSWLSWDLWLTAGNAHYPCTLEYCRGEIKLRKFLSLLTQFMSFNNGSGSPKSPGIVWITNMSVSKETWQIQHLQRSTYSPQHKSHKYCNFSSTKQFPFKISLRKVVIAALCLKLSVKGKLSFQHT